MDRLRLRLPVAMAAVALVIVACTSSASAPTATTPDAIEARITYTPAGCLGVGLEAIAEAGATSIVVENQSDATVYFEPGRLLDGKGFEAFAEHGAQEQARHGRGEPLAGPPSFIERSEGLDVAAGATGALAVPTTPGTYGIACVVFDVADGPPVNAFVVGPLEIPG